jgi:glycosyltransferase involved in cell wall biosynthesis
VISVITATYQNQPELQRAIASLEAQAFTDWQHVVVADGPDPQLRARMCRLGYAPYGQRVFIEMGRNWHGFLGGDGAGQPPGSPGARGARGSRGVSAYLTGTYLASGDHIAYLDSDCEYTPGHLAACAKALEASGADFVFTRMRRYLDGQPWDVVGDGGIGHGRIDGNLVVHKAGLLRTANWRWGGDADYDLIQRWHQAGATFEHVPEITVFWHHARDDM